MFTKCSLIFDLLREQCSLLRMLLFCSENTSECRVNIFYRRKHRFFSCFSTVVNVSNLLSEHMSEHLFPGFNSRKYPCKSEHLGFTAHGGVVVNE